MCDEVVLHAYAGRDWLEDARTSYQALGVTTCLKPISADIVFRYFHPMSVAELVDCPSTRASPIEVSGEAVLRFGFVEGTALVRAKRCVFDPQNPVEALGFRDNGSEAESLAVVLNEAELRESTRADDDDVAVERLRQACDADVVVIKRGPRGAEVRTRSTVQVIPARVSPEVFKIGSGDVFSAVFAFHWAKRGSDPVFAAEAASRAVARYVATRDLISLDAPPDEFPAAPSKRRGGPIYLAAPFFNLAQRWMVEQARDALLSLGATVFSPLHEVGMIGSTRDIAEADLEGLRRCESVLAIVDGEDAGTLFEIGYARHQNIPVVVLAENPRFEALTMLEGSGCRITRDLTSAVYHAVWAALA